MYHYKLRINSLVESLDFKLFKKSKIKIYKYYVMHLRRYIIYFYIQIIYIFNEVGTLIYILDIYIFYYFLHIQFI